MLIPRFIKKQIIKRIEPNKVVVIYGPRRAGKTTLLNEILKDIKEKYLLLSGEDREVKNWLSSQSINILKENIGNNKLVVIDEAQKVNKIGLNLKLIVDHIENIKVIATGSSSFELANQVGEPLVGRKWQFTLFPIAQLELSGIEEVFESREKLGSRLIYGTYPDVIVEKNITKKGEILNSLVDNYLYRDLLEFDEIRKANKILELLKLIAFQIGNEVSLNELANNLSINQRTVEKYLDLLEKVFVIKRVYGFSRNLRKEIYKNSRFYFYDNGVRNALINNFNDLKTRDDIGKLWENFLFIERMKKQSYKKIYCNNYFWRTWDKKEIDLVEERGGKLFGFEFKWGDKKIKAPKLWKETYKNAEFKVINRENFLKFVV
ncbi:ATP-binding protein [Patescibacteria group bacterium]|nr:ATP-binding protein [Patescibacteria group bacterium]MCG2701691.1 ATP-binding protein [Candidatus Parcubacteria bacterium]MBU4265374.1 ATP-binding protein [Patescibacteria group bacterium]MBU4390326.1 ATP-binding protein [Patescibacteria group bacterium]MBU4396573.1 ATP-binding protein [Patescibacteria group bacterium]